MPAPPEKAKLEKSVEEYRAKDGDVERAVLLRAFAAQAAIEWPELDALLEEES